jgi:hypothetical protein
LDVDIQATDGLDANDIVGLELTGAENIARRAFVGQDLLGGGIPIDTWLIANAETELFECSLDARNGILDTGIHRHAAKKVTVGNFRATLQEILPRPFGGEQW